jgi:hypothetical protein
MKQQIITTGLFLIALIAITIPGAFYALGAASDSFTVALTVGNVAPVIEEVQANAAGSPSAGTTTIVQIRFNVSDQNAQSTLNDSAAYVNLTQASVQRQSSVCSGSQINLTHRTYLCNVTIYFYDAPGIWNIWAYAQDNSLASDVDNSSSFTMGNTDDITIDAGSISFTGNPGQNDIQSTPGNVTINNTGNQNYPSVGLTAFDLESAVDQIGAGNFSVNISNSPNGQALRNNTILNVTGATLSRGATAVEELFVYLDVPAGAAGSSYSSVASWIIDPSTT